MRVLKRGLATHVTVAPGDTISLIYHDFNGREHVVLQEVVAESHTFDDGVILESDPGEFGADYGLGGMFLEHKSPPVSEPETPNPVEA